MILYRVWGWEGPEGSEEDSVIQRGKAVFLQSLSGLVERPR